jgi:lactoylglutathione lyase
MQLSYAIVFVSDMRRAVAFYRDILGLPLKFESPEWTEFATEGATLALHAADEAAGEPAAASGTARKTPAGTCRPGLSVPNLDEFHRRMVERNVPCLQPPQDLFGARLAQYADPDGLAISVSQQRRG